MKNIIDYIDWRGDLTFKQSSFNEIDAVIFTQIAYMELSVPCTILESPPLVVLGIRAYTKTTYGLKTFRFYLSLVPH